ncbi:MAG: hypothetical protein J1F38_04005 [Muribaculaceae bacterium]|nr:hypothetical protein [Muribaculaceae bacterium]
MKKLLLIVAAIITGISVSAQDLEWSDLGEEIASGTNASVGAIEESFKSNGLDVKASTHFNPSTNSVNITFDFGSLDIVSLLNEESLTVFKDSFADAFVQGFLEEPGTDNNLFVDHVKIMEKGKGEYRLILKGNGNSKVIRITPQDLKRVGAKNYGVKF